MSDTEDYAALFLGDVPMMDTRAPAEFARGSFPTAINLPLMTDSERSQVGKCYKQRGQQAAIELGHKLVNGDLKRQRIESWLNFARSNPDGYLFCFRGGLRSQICQQWMREAGCDYPRIAGGYKAMRRFLLNTLERESSRRRIILLGGYTGAAKTALLESISNSMDLEAMAHHRGSAFGNRPGGQPPQISFENSIAIGFLKHAHWFRGQATVLEDEGRLIGQRYLPQCLRQAMDKAPLVVVESSLEERIEHTFSNYILDALRERQMLHGESEGFRQFSEYLKRSLFNIRRRLGGARYNQTEKALTSALELHRGGSAHAHKQWIEILLRDYYDPMYRYHLQEKRDRLVFSGNARDVLVFLVEEHARAKMA